MRKGPTVTWNAVRDLEAMLVVASELLEAVRRLERGVGIVKDRECVLRLVTPLDDSKDQPYRLNLGEDLTLWASRTDKDTPDLTRGVIPSDKTLAAQGRWGLTQIIRRTSAGHFGVAVVDGKVSTVASDAYGGALLQIAERLTEGQPVTLLPQQRVGHCERCGEKMTALRSTKRYCSNACQQAMVRARRRAREEDAQ